MFYNCEIELIYEKEEFITQGYYIELEIIKDIFQEIVNKPYYLELEFDIIPKPLTYNNIYDIELLNQQNIITESQTKLIEYYDIEIEYFKNKISNNNEFIELEIIENNIVPLKNDFSIYDIELLYEQVFLNNNDKEIYELEIIETGNYNISKEKLEIEIEYFTDIIDIPYPEDNDNDITIPNDDDIILPEIIETPPIIYQNINLNDINILINSYKTDDENRDKKTLIDNILKDWYANEELKYHRIINFKNDKWYNLSISNIYFDNSRRNLPEFFRKYDIEQAYVIEDGVYKNILDKEIYDKYFNNNYNIYSSLVNEYYIPTSLSNLNDSCFIKKKSKNISCLIIGINYYNNNLLRLEGPDNDSVKMGNILKEYYGDRIHITIMNEKMEDENMIPNFKNIKKELDNLIMKSATENIIFYYAGHIGQEKDKNKDENDRLDEHLITTDNIYITDDWFYHNFIKKIFPQCKCRLFIDACFSQGFCDLPFQLNKLGEFQLVRQRDENVAEVICLTSSKEDQLSYEKFNDLSGLYGGVFTEEFTKNINNVGNFDILYSFRLVNINLEAFDKKQNIAITTTYTFAREPILLL